jgi:hypothetical protein
MMQRIPIPALAGALLLASTLAAFIGMARPLAAQDIAGEYQVEVRGTIYHLDRKPAQSALQDNTILTVEQQGDEIVIQFRSFAGAMSATTFRGRVGNGRFVAIWSPPSGSGDARLITGMVDGNRLRGRLIYPSTTPDAAVPGWTEVEFSAVRQGRSSQGSTGAGGEAATPARQPTPRDRLPIGRRPGRPAPAPAPAANAAAGADFAVDVAAMTVPDAPLAGHRIEFVARGTPSVQGESIERMELWINGLVQGSSDGSLLEVEAGPFDAGNLNYDVVAVSADGRRSRPTTHRVRITASGGSVIRGTISGDRGAISDVQLVRPNGRVAALTRPDASGDYHFTGVPAGDYVIFVNDGKTEARVSPTSNLSISVDGRGSYTRDFQVR